MSVTTTQVEHHRHTPEGHPERTCLHLLDTDGDECAIHEERDHPDEVLIVGCGPRITPLAFLAALDRVAVVALRDHLDAWLTRTQAEAPTAPVPDTLED